MANVTVYWRPMCGYCEILKSRLRTNGVDYESVDIWEHRFEAEVVREANNGDELVPTVRVGDRFLANPSIDEVMAALEEAA